MTSSYPQLTPSQCESYAVKFQRAWHWNCYDAQRQAEILARVQRLIAANPNGYLAKHWKDVYR